MKFTELLSQKYTNGQNGIELEKVNESIEQSIETLCGRIGEGSIMLLADIYCDIYCTMWQVEPDQRMGYLSSCPKH